MKKLAAAALAAFAMTAAIPAGSASAIGKVACGNSEYLRVEYHYTTGGTYTDCFANAGSWRIYDQFGRSVWVTEIWTGNNRAKWYGDGQWRPATAIGQWTSFTWPNTPGGVKLDEIQIL
ncbi:hypothetical protein [Umezawaea beigongshangensis]|uniref:hypothetical protein n=1 Tax=Umezawaea beigongshangensis TaxID=2780383 RepID=UPI0018F1B8FE|nr:hypothetical protein [Umezawaea beigongshangensis]